MQKPSLMLAVVVVAHALIARANSPLLKVLPPARRSLYPISEGRPLVGETRETFINRIEERIRELKNDRASRPELNALPATFVERRSLAVTQVSCRVARHEHFTNARKKRLDAENLSSWVRLFPETGAARWSGATECYRAYLEAQVGSGFAVYGAKIREQVVIVEIWSVPEVI